MVSRSRTGVPMGVHHPGQPTDFSWVHYQSGKVPVKQLVPHTFLGREGRGCWGHPPRPSGPSDTSVFLFIDVIFMPLPSPRRSLRPHSKRQRNDNTRKATQTNQRHLTDPRTWPHLPLASWSQETGRQSERQTASDQLPNPLLLGKQGSTDHLSGRGRVSVLDRTPEPPRAGS